MAAGWEEERWQGPGDRSSSAGKIAGSSGVRVQWTDERGKRRSKATTLQGKHRDAQRQLRKLIDQIEQRGDVKLELRKQTLAQYLAEWLEDRQGISPRTRALYQNQLNKHVVPAIGNVRVGDLRRQHLERLLRTLDAAGLAPGSQTVVLRWLLPAIDGAIEAGALVADPRRKLQRPGAKAVRKQRALSVDELQRLLKAADASGDTFLSGLVYVLALSGIRPGEALALRWADLDQASGRVRIEHAVTIGQTGELVLGPPKTDSSVRDVVLPELVIHRLRAHRAAQAEIALSGGGKRPELIFADPRTGGISDYRQDVRHRLATVFKRAALAGVTAYCLRHSCASQLLAAGVGPAEIATQLGHKNARITLAIYSHALPGSAERTSATLARAILGT